MPGTDRDRVHAGGQREHRRVDPIGAIGAVAPACPAPGSTSTARSGCGRAGGPDAGAAREGVEQADSWATDGHKWLNVPYDCGMAIVRDRSAHHRGEGVTSATYLVLLRNSATGSDWVTEFTRRGRGSRSTRHSSLGRRRVRRLVDRCCALARRIADGVGGRAAGVVVLNEVVLNQVLVRFGDDDRDPAASDALTRATLQEIQDEGTIWLSGTTWHDMAAIRVSVSNWGTGAEEAELAAATILAAAERVRATDTAGS